jgi:hypothetical protein
MTVAVREVKNAGLLILKHALASRPSGPWNDDDYDVLADGVVIGSIFNAKTAPVGRAVDVDVAIPAQQGPHANTRL